MIAAFSTIRPVLAAVVFGLLAVTGVRSEAQTFLLDFGSSQLTNNQQSQVWNNVTTAIGTASTGTLLDLATTEGTIADIDLSMVARFNNENTNGTTASTFFPSSATVDSLFGNTEAFNGFSNIFPKFKFSSLDRALTYNLTFYASRMGVTDNRETLYTVTGGTQGMAALDVANNVNNAATVFGITPDVNGEILVALTPGANNNNGNHFTYLGAMELQAAPEPTDIITLDIRAHIDGRDRLVIRGDTLQWQHFDNAAVGRHEGQNLPTIITTTLNGVAHLNRLEWIPGWSAPPPDEIRSPAASSIFSGLMPSMPQQPASVSLQLIEARSVVRIIQTPTLANDYTTILEFDDNAELGSDWYQAKLIYPIP